MAWIPQNQSHWSASYWGADPINWLRDRALVGTIVYSFARVGVAIMMKLGDYF